MIRNRKQTPYDFYLTGGASQPELEGPLSKILRQLSQAVQCQSSKMQSCSGPEDHQGSAIGGGPQGH